jgi:predicted signal transduction protein with EAL and GGDEF domain
MITTILLTIAIAMRLDHAWKLVRRAAGYEQKEGMLERIFVISVFIGAIAFATWLFVISGPGSDFGPKQ